MSGLTFNIDALREKTSSARVEKTQSMQAAEDLAFEKFENILSSETFNEKMEEAANNGRDTVDFYTWEYVPKEDPRYMFGGIRILDIVKRTDLKSRLNLLVNPDQESGGLFISHRVTNRKRGQNAHKRKHNDEPTKYALYISWRIRKPKPSHGDDDDDDE